MELMNVQLGFFTGLGGDERFALVVHFSHQFGGYLPVVTKHALKNENHIGHQVHGIVPNNDIPERGEFFSRVRAGRGCVTFCRLRRHLIKGGESRVRLALQSRQYAIPPDDFEQMEKTRAARLTGHRDADGMNQISRLQSMRFRRLFQNRFQGRCIK